MANAVRGLVSVGLITVIAALVGSWLAAESYAQADKPSIVGAWKLNKDLSDRPTDRSDRGDSGGNRGNRGGFGGGGRRRGGFGGGGFGGGGRGGYGGGQQMDPESAQRLREAMRDIVNAPEK